MNNHGPWWEWLINFFFFFSCHFWGWKTNTQIYVKAPEVILPWYVSFKSTAHDLAASSQTEPTEGNPITLWRYSKKWWKPLHFLHSAIKDDLWLFLIPAGLAVIMLAVFLEEVGFFLRHVPLTRRTQLHLWILGMYPVTAIPLWHTHRSRSWCSFGLIWCALCLSVWMLFVTQVFALTSLIALYVPRSSSLCNFIASLWVTGLRHCSHIYTGPTHCLNVCVCVRLCAGITLSPCWSSWLWSQTSLEVKLVWWLLCQDSKCLQTPSHAAVAAVSQWCPSPGIYYLFMPHKHLTHKLHCPRGDSVAYCSHWYCIFRLLPDVMFAASGQCSSG